MIEWLLIEVVGENWREICTTFLVPLGLAAVWACLGLLWFMLAYPRVGEKIAERVLAWFSK